MVVTRADKRRSRRRKLVAHDRGNDRHNKGVSLFSKLSRLAVEHASQVSNKRYRRKT